MTFFVSKMAKTCLYYLDWLDSTSFEVFKVCHSYLNVLPMYIDIENCENPSKFVWSSLDVVYKSMKKHKRRMKRKKYPQKHVYVVMSFMREKPTKPTNLKNLNTLFKLWSRITENINAQFNLCYVILISLKFYKKMYIMIKLYKEMENFHIYRRYLFKFHQKKAFSHTKIVRLVIKLSKRWYVSALLPNKLLYIECTYIIIRVEYL